MDLSANARNFLSELSRKTGKSEQDLIELAIFELVCDKHKFVVSPNTGEMWLKDEIDSIEPVVEFIDRSGKSFFWVQHPDAQESRKLIGDRIRQLREDAGLTQGQLAEEVGMTQPNIFRIESGKYSTGQDILSKIAAALGKRLDIV